MDYDFNRTRQLPRIVEVDPRVLPEPYASVCIRNRVRLHALIGYENEGESIKVWPASGIVVGGIARGEHRTTDTMIESTSGNFGIGLAVVLEAIHKRAPDFPLRKLIAVVPKSLQEDKKARLRSHECIELREAEDAIKAMELAARLAQECGYWYTRQYWNPDNPAAYRRIAEEIARRLPQLGIFAAGVGSGGTFAGIMPVLREAFKHRARPRALHSVAVTVAPKQSVGGVRSNLQLMVVGEEGLPWKRYRDVTVQIGLDLSLELSAAIWNQPRSDERRIVGGESTGFALAGGLSAVIDLEKDGFDALRDEAGNVHLLFVAPDTRGPYREDYERHGIQFP